MMHLYLIIIYRLVRWMFLAFAGQAFNYFRSEIHKMAQNELKVSFQVQEFMAG